MPRGYGSIPRDPQAPLLTRRALDQITDRLNDLEASGILVAVPAPGGGIRWTIPGAAEFAAGRHGPPGRDAEEPDGERVVLLPASSGSGGGGGGTAGARGPAGSPGTPGEDGEDGGLFFMPPPSVRTPALLFTHQSDVGTTHTDGTEDTLYSDTLFANQLSRNGDTLSLLYSGRVADSGGTATRRVKLYFAGTAIVDSGDYTVAGVNAWQLRCDLIRVSASVVRFTATFFSELTLLLFDDELTGLTLGSAVTILVKGAAAGTGAASGDVTAKMAFLSFHPAP